MRRRSGSLRSTWTPPQRRPISLRSTTRQHRTTKKRKSSSQHSSPRSHQRISATSKQPKPVPSPPRITLSQVEMAIEKLSPKKAPGPDEIPNLILKKCYNEIKEHLLLIAQESLETGHFPTIFKKSTTLVIHKPNKPDKPKPKWR